MNNVNDTLGNRIRFLRVRAGFTSRQVAKEIGVSLGTYSHFETGKTQPKADEIKHLALLYNVTTDFLLGYTAPSKKHRQEKKRKKKHD